MVIAITLVAAMLLGTGFVLQQHAAEQEPQESFLRLRLITGLLHRPRWLLGFAVMVSGQLLSAWCVGHLELSQYEPLLATSLIFALALAVPLSRQRLRVTELIGAVILSCGVAALSLGRSPGTPSASFGSFSDWPAAAGIAALAYCFIHAGHRRSGPLRATLTGTGAGLVFGISDALTRRTVQILDAHSFLGLVTNWPPWCLLAAALIANWLMQNAFSAAPLHASLPGITAAEPVAGILLGVVVFGDEIQISPGRLAIQAAGIAALVVGVIMVARAPILSHLHHAPRLERLGSHGADRGHAPGVPRDGDHAPGVPPDGDHALGVPPGGDAGQAPEVPVAGEPAPSASGPPDGSAQPDGRAPDGTAPTPAGAPPGSRFPAGVRRRRQ